MRKNRLLLLLLFPLTGCCLIGPSGNFSWANYRNDSVAMSLESSKFANFNLQNFTTLDSDMNSLKSIVTSKGSVRSFNDSYYSLYKKLVKILDCYVIASTKYYADCNEIYKNKSDVYYSQYVDLSKFFMDLEEDIYYSSSEIRQSYFGAMTNAEIEDRLSTNQESKIEADYDKILNDYKDEGSELYAKYRQDQDKDYYLDKGYDYFLRYVKKGNELADQLSHYDNYLEYSYKNDYARDYKVSEALNVVDFVKKYLVPICKEKASIDVPNDVSKNLLQIIGSYNFCNESTNLSDTFLNYAVTMGDKYLSAYNRAFRDGYYCFSDSNNSMSTAYQWGLSSTNDSVLYFSKYYQNVLSVIHEFGHYYSCTQSNGIRKNDAIDLQETYSQGNEFTFLNYLLKEVKDDPNYATYAYYADEEAYRSAVQICQEAAITEIEYFAYTTPDLTKEALIQGVEDILESYDGVASDTYFMAACIASPCYYISYATSLVEAVQLYAMSFEDAKTAYTKLVETSGAYSMVERWENAGLVSPFKEEAYIKIGNMFGDISDKY